VVSKGQFELGTSWQDGWCHSWFEFSTSQKDSVSWYEVGTSQQDGWCHSWSELGTSQKDNVS
jgi:hypothetical protein